MDVDIIDKDIITELSKLDLVHLAIAECYDMQSLMDAMRENFKDICRVLDVKSIQCTIDFSTETFLAQPMNMHFVIYETEGPEFDNFCRTHRTPSGESVQVEISYLTRTPTEEQLLKGKSICELVFLSVSRVRIATNLEDALNKDMVTGMPNTRAFYNYGEKLFRDYSIADYCVLALNISNFKFVNQTVPFVVGTSVLIKYAHKLLSFMKADEFATRAGGDNFNIVVKKENLEEFLENVKSIPIDIKDGNMRVHFDLTCYIGICTVETRMSIQVAVENATSAMTLAKNTPHSPVVFYTDEIGEKQHHANRVRAGFQKGIENHEFIAYYQPKVNLITQEIIGMEALVRWEKEGAILNPGQFVGILENSRSIMELDMYMLKQVCRDIKRWESMGIKIPRISVNLSRRNLQNENIVDEIAAILDEYHVDYKYVEIEVTETVDNDEFKNLADFIKKMKQRGIKVSIDDFGTGYSSLNLLRSLDADVLKIDRSFINLPSFSETDELLVRSIVNLAKAYNMEVITEGVETNGQIKFLLEVGCRNVQGYFFDKPLTKEIVTERLKLGRYNKQYDLE